MPGARQVVVVGSFNVDHAWHLPVLPRAGETLAGSYSTGPGGKGFNQAVAAARSGAATRFVCALGDDAGGALARALAQDNGIALEAVASEAPTGTAGIFVDERGRNNIVIGAGANADLDRASIEARAGLFTGAAVVLAQLESPFDTVLSALRVGRSQGATTILNPAPAPAAGAPARNAMLDATDVLTPNESEFTALLQGNGPLPAADAVATMDDDALHALCRRLLPGGTVVVTLGAAGAFVSHAETTLRGDGNACYRVPAEAADVVDTTAAGDAFNGALAATLAAGAACFGDGIRFAVRFAALATERAGAAASLPTKAEVEARFGVL